MVHYYKPITKENLYLSVREMLKIDDELSKKFRRHKTKSKFALNKIKGYMFYGFNDKKYFEEFLEDFNEEKIKKKYKVEKVGWYNCWKIVSEKLIEFGE